MAYNKACRRHPVRLARYMRGYAPVVQASQFMCQYMANTMLYHVYTSVVSPEEC